MIRLPRLYGCGELDYRDTRSGPVRRIFGAGVPGLRFFGARGPIKYTIQYDKDYRQRIKTNCTGKRKGSTHSPKMRLPCANLVYRPNSSSMIFFLSKTLKIPCPPFQNILFWRGRGGRQVTFCHPRLSDIFCHSSLSRPWSTHFDWFSQ